MMIQTRKSMLLFIPITCAGHKFVHFNCIFTISEQKKKGDVLLNACKDIGLAVNTDKTRYMEVGCHRGMIINYIS